MAGQGRACVADTPTPTPGLSRLAPSVRCPAPCRSVTALDFSVASTIGAQRVAPCKLRDAGNLLPQDLATPEFSTSSRLHFPGRSTLDARRLAAAGQATHDNGAYHIIHGGAALTNNNFERFDGRDYRRHFPLT